MTHVLVHWEDENSFSTVSLKRVDTGNNSVEEIIGNTFRIKWNKNYHTGRILKVGTSEEIQQMEVEHAQAAADFSFMESELDDEDLLDKNNTDEYIMPSATVSIEQTPHRDAADLANVKTGLPVESNGEAQGAGIIDDQLHEDDEDNAHSDRIAVDALKEKDNLIAKMHSENEELKRQNVKLRRVIRKRGQDSLELNETMVQISAGIEINKSIVDLTKLMYSARPSLFIRKLIFEGGVFTLQEIADSSMTGKSSPMFPELKRPPLDPVRLQVLKEFTKDSCGVIEKTPACIAFEQSLKNLPGDARKKLKASRQKVGGTS